MNVCLLLNEQDEMYYKLYSFTAAATACLCPIPPMKMLIIPLDSTTLSCHYPLHLNIMTLKHLKPILII